VGSIQEDWEEIAESCGGEFRELATGTRHEDESCGLVGDKTTEEFRLFSG
jgi:hypothetical protein